MHPTFIAAPLLGVVLIGGAVGAHAQTLDPRSFVNTPVGMNFAVGGYSYSWGNVAFDPSVPIENAELTAQGGVAGYARAMNLWGLSGKVNAGGGFVCADGSADVQGVRETRHVCGLTDLSTFASVNFIGAPAISLSEYPRYHQGFLMGASLGAVTSFAMARSTLVMTISPGFTSSRPE